MMDFVSLDLLKKHVCADDFTADDDLLSHYLQAAQQTIIGRTGRTPEELRLMAGGEFPTPLRQAVMLLVGHWYNQREAVASVQMHEVPLGVLSLVKPYIRLSEP